MSSKTFIAALASAAAVNAHGFVSDIIVNGQSNTGYNPTNAPWVPEQDSAGWANWATDTGFVPSSSLQDPDIICHLDAKNAPKSIEVAAGTEITLQWTEWPRSHHGPVVDYLAKCDGECETVDKTSLKFFKFAEMGQIELGPGGGETGYWASDKFIDDGMFTTVRAEDRQLLTSIFRLPLEGHHSRVHLCRQLRPPPRADRPALGRPGGPGPDVPTVHQPQGHRRRLRQPRGHPRY